MYSGRNVFRELCRAYSRSNWSNCKPRIRLGIQDEVVGCKQESRQLPLWNVSSASGTTLVAKRSKPRMLQWAGTSGT